MIGSRWRLNAKIGWGIVAGVSVGLLAGLVVYGLGIEEARNKPWREIDPALIPVSLASRLTIQRGSGGQTLLIFMDYTCGGCRSILPLMKNYPAVKQKEVAIQVVIYPLDRLSRGWEAAEAVMLAEKHGMGAMMHDYLLLTEPDDWDFEQWSSDYKLSKFCEGFNDAANLGKIKAITAECEKAGLVQSPSMALVDASGRIELSPNVRAMWQRLDEL